jgi:hypothetical protein
MNPLDDELAAASFPERRFLDTAYIDRRRLTASNAVGLQETGARFAQCPAVRGMIA